MNIDLNCFFTIIKVYQKKEKKLKFVVVNSLFWIITNSKNLKVGLYKVNIVCSVLIKIKKNFILNWFESVSKLFRLYQYLYAS